MLVYTFKSISSYRVFLILCSVFGEVEGKNQLLTATNVCALSQSMKKKVDLEAERY